MSALHRAGLAGLWMTLKAFEMNGTDKLLAKEGGSWTTSDDEVILKVNGEPGKFFDALIRESFKVDRDGRVWFPALGEPRDHPEASALLNDCLLGTFLQHPRVRKADPAAKPTGITTVTIDDIERPLNFRKIWEYQHQKVRIKKMDDPQPFVSWLYPGSAVRHEAFDVTGMQGSLEQFLPLLYSIIGVLYFIVKKRGIGTQYAIVIPDVANLSEYALYRRKYAPKDERELTVSGAGEAALRLLATLKAEKLMNAVGSTACRVMIFGKVKWNKQQKARVQVFDVRRELTNLDTYEMCRQLFRPRQVELKAGGYFWDFPQVPELVAKNLLLARPWWRDFSIFISNKDVGDHIYGTGKEALYKGEREELAKMVADTVKKPMNGDVLEVTEAAFVEACQEAWRRRLGALSQTAQDSGADFGNLVRKELIRTRLSFSKCKNEATFRETITDFWARAGSVPSLQSNWRGVLALLNADWRLAKDLALLALASYASKEEEETAPL
jgi:CRISPR-associated protein Cas8a1/Csx13